MIKKGILLSDFMYLQITDDDLDTMSIEEFEMDEVLIIQKDKVVEVIKEIEDESYSSGLAFVIIASDNEAITVDSTLVKLFKE